MTFFYLTEGHRATSSLDWQTSLSYLSVIHLKAVTTTVSQIFSKTVINDLILTFSEGHRAKLIQPMDCQAPLSYMSVICLEHVTAIVKEIFDETVMIDLF